MYSTKIRTQTGPKQRPDNRYSRKNCPKTRMIHDSVSKHLLHAYMQYKQYYDKKVSAHPLALIDYCYTFSPRSNNQRSKLPFREYLRTGPFVVVKTLPTKNYLIRKLQTNKTQILHRIRLKPCPTKDRLPDIQVQTKDFQPDNDVEILHDDLFALAWQSVFEHFVMPPNHNLNSEPTLIPIDNENNSESGAQETAPDILPDNHPGEEEIQETRSETDPDPEANSPGKENITYEVTSLQTGKTIMLITTQ